MNQRPRRNRKSSAVRDLVRETVLLADDFVLPVFIENGKKKKQAISTLPGQYRSSVDELLIVCENAAKLGIKGLALFPKIEDSKKNSQASEALNNKGLVPTAIREIKKRFPELVIFSDIALDPFSSDGHDGLVKNGKIINDETVVVLSEMACVHADAGADFVAPSDMMDGRVGGIRKKLDKAKFTEVGIMAYTAKYASSFYGPFRDALDSAPRAGDKKTYQMDPANSREALKELKLDIKEGADIVMVKPALSYLDIIKLFQQNSSVPVAAYNVSGEYAMIKAAAKNGWLDEVSSRNEALLSMKRAGADILFSYFAIDYAQWFKKNS
ncbi:MAG: porphobilinogen synthase [Bdellovibrionaceae bacterium]|nr:porphobilinogen synthase [Pseudobdellovibrionaceae bacterium]